MAVLQAPAAYNAIDPAWEIYYRLRPQIETPENIGKLILLDLDSGDYEIAEDDLGFAASALVRQRRSAADLFALRIGYEASASLLRFHGAPARMMRGVTIGRKATMPVTFRLPGQPNLTLEFVVDTGFTESFDSARHQQSRP